MDKFFLLGVSTICPGVVNTPITRNVRLTGDLVKDRSFGQRVSRLYEKRNYGPERVAAAIVRAVDERRGLLPVTPESWAFYYAKRIAPGLLERLMARDVAI